MKAAQRRQGGPPYPSHARRSSAGPPGVPHGQLHWATPRHVGAREFRQGAPKEAWTKAAALSRPVSGTSARPQEAELSGPRPLAGQGGSWREAAAEAAQEVVGSQQGSCAQQRPPSAGSLLPHPPHPPPEAQLGPPRDWTSRFDCTVAARRSLCARGAAGGRCMPWGRTPTSSE